MTINEDTLQELLGRAVTDFGATLHAPLVVIGDKLGLYKALAEHGPLHSDALAERTDTAKRYVREWLASQTAGGYITYDPATECYHLSEEQAAMLADENSPAFVPGNFQVAVSASKIEPRLVEAFCSGEGIGWHEHDHALFHGVERAFRSDYVADLVDNWIPALEGVTERLKQGGRVADVGCGFGASTLLMAEAFPNSTFTGFDYHQASVDAANQRAQTAGLADRVTFETASAKSYNGGDYDFVAVFDCLHDMGDPAGAAAHVLESLKGDGTWMIVEPFANDRLEDNINPIGRAFYSVSTLVCTPRSLDQEVGRALGAQAGRRVSAKSSPKAALAVFAGPPGHPSTWSTRPGHKGPRPFTRSRDTCPNAHKRKPEEYHVHTNEMGNNRCLRHINRRPRRTASGGYGTARGDRTIQSRSPRQPGGSRR